MRASVRPMFITMITKTEAVCTWPYLDTLGFVTTGIGNKIDPIQLAVTLPWKRRDGSRATPPEIVNEWNHVKALTSLERAGGFAYASQTQLRLSKEDVMALVNAKIDEMWSHLVARFSDLEEWPSDAQLGLLSMAWAAGPNFRAPHFDAACHALNFTGAAAECALHTRRDLDDRHCFLNAAAVVDQDLDPDVLYYPDAPMTTLKRIA